MFEANYYKLLQVDPEAEPDVIAAAHRVLTAKLHPERDISGVAEIRVAEYHRALAVLTDPERRRAYDASLEERDRVAMGPGYTTTLDHAGSRNHSLSDRIRNQSDDDGSADARLDFGRYEGWTLRELARHDADYLRWLSRHSSGIRFRGPILRLLADLDQRVPLRAPSTTPR